MHPNSKVFDMTLHLNDGRLVVFSRKDERESEELLNAIAPSEVFSRKALILRNEESLSLFPTDKIARLEFSQMISQWTDPDEVMQADQIADYDFQWLRETLSAVKRQFPENRRLDDSILAADLELANSEHLFLRVEFSAPTGNGNPKELLIDRILNTGGLIVRLREGGFTTINPKSVVRLTLYPMPNTAEVSHVNRAVG
jgi:hypothetical protein